MSRLDSEAELRLEKNQPQKASVSAYESTNYEEDRYSDCFI